MKSFVAKHWRRRGTRFTAMVCCMAILCGCLFTTTVYAESPAEKYKRLKEELQQTRDAIDSYKNDLSAAKQLKAALEEEKTIIDQMVEVNQQEIERTGVELEQKEIEVAEKRQVIYENDQLLQQRLVAIYNMNSASLAAELLSVDGYGELFQIMDGMQRISKHDTDLLKMLNEQREQLEVEQAEIDQMLADLRAYHDELLQNQADLANNIVSTDSRITNAEAQIKAKEEIEGEQYAALLQAQREMQAIAGSIGGSRKGDGSTYVGGVFTWPVPGYYTISCHFGAPDPNGRGHRGMDISTGGKVGPDIVACGDGRVVLVNTAHGSYGLHLAIDHGDGVKTLYAHCSAIYVGVGQEVTKGEPIAAVGSTGFSTGPHLHLEVLIDNALQNPAAWLKG